MTTVDNKDKDTRGYLPAVVITLCVIVGLLTALYLTRLDDYYRGRDDCLSTYQVCVRTTEGWLPYSG